MRRLIISLLCYLPVVAIAQNKDKKAIAAYLDQQTPMYADIAKKIWGYAEVGYQEEKSAALLQSTLQQEGFTVKAGIAGIPTAFVATYGSGQPVIGILAE